MSTPDGGGIQNESTAQRTDPEIEPKQTTRLAQEVREELTGAQQRLSIHASIRANWAECIADVVASGEYLADPESFSSLVDEYNQAKAEATSAAERVARLNEELVTAPFPVPNAGPEVLIERKLRECGVEDGIDMRDAVAFVQSLSAPPAPADLIAEADRWPSPDPADPTRPAAAPADLIARLANALK